MKTRKAKIREHLLTSAKNKNYSTEMVLYIKEVHRLKEEGFTLERVFSNEFDHPERNSYLYKVSWKNPVGVCCYACFLKEIAVNS